MGVGGASAGEALDLPLLAWGEAVTELLSCRYGWRKVGAETVSPLLPDWPMEPRIGTPYCPQGREGGVS